MYRLLAVVVLVMLVLAGAMSLRNIVTAHGNGPVMMANGGDPVPRPPAPWKNGGDPVPRPPAPWK